MDEKIYDSKTDEIINTQMWVKEDWINYWLDYISEEAWSIRCDWEDPRGQCREIMRAVKEIKKLMGIDNG